MPTQAFPYTPRPGQQQLMDLIREAFDSRRHVVVESGTGTGKTVCALCGALDGCRSRGRKLLYLTRTNSQQRQVMYELRRIGGDPRLFGVALQGRRNMCPLAMTDEELSGGNPEELSKVCSERKARVMRGEEDACRYFASTMSEDLQAVSRYMRRELPTAEELAAHCTDLELCPYEVTKMHVPAADVVAAPYIMFFDGFIRHNLLEWMGCSPGDVVAIVDEAHNLPSYARELRSSRLSDVTLRLARTEVDEFGDQEVSDGVSLCDLLSLLEGALERALEEYLIDEDGVIPQSFLEEELMFRLGLTSHKVKGMLTEAMHYGELVRDARKVAGRLPRSFVHRTAGFLAFWQGLEEGEYVKLIVKGDAPAFEAYCLDASLACAPLLECLSSVHMSGTLRPIEDYIQTTGLPQDALQAAIPSPFPGENLCVLYVDDVTTRFEDIERSPEMVDRIAGHIVRIVNACSNRNAIVFHPSYAMAERVGAVVDGGVPRERLFHEERGMAQAEVMDAVKRFKSARGGAVLHAVMGGRVSEGIDFPAGEMEVAVIAGIPYPKPTARHRALQYFCDIRFGDGWSHAVKAPTNRKLLQAVGRLIRSETDRGIAVILDRRAVHFSDSLPARRSVVPEQDAASFFSG
ncbi:MAG: ATP-dependent DNA helicase [Methanobacteriota archaeon]|nr:MAG: ATP-dependent DNA helicase [Euryarchaeota archaeon]